MKTKTKSLDELAKECKQSYERWTEIRQNGCRDPCWTDGVNLNLVRNHIIYYKRQMATLYKEQGVEPPPVLLRELPPRLDPKFMANADEIRQRANEIMTKIEEMPEFDELNTIYLGLSPVQKSQSGCQYVMNWVSRLKSAIEHDELVVMRIHIRQVDCVYEKMSDALAQAKAMPVETYQLSLFDIA